MAAGDLVVFNQAKMWLADGTMDLDDTTSDQYKVALITTLPLVTEATPILATFTEVTGGGTYTTGGESIVITSGSWAESSGTVTFDTATNPQWLQNASNPTDARAAVFYRDGTHNSITDPFLLMVDLGGVIDMTAGDLTITWNASGLFTLA